MAVRSARTAPIKRRMHPIGVITTIVQAVRQFLVLIVAAFIGGSSEDRGGALFQGGMLVLVVIYGIGRWFRLRYWFEGDAMRVSDGFLLHREIFLEKDKVQAVDIRAGLLQRLFNVVRVQIKTGATGTQVDLTALSRTEAERIQRLLAPGQITEDAVPAVAGPDMEAPPARPSWTLSSKELIALGATSGRIGVVASFVGWLFSQAHERVTAFIETNLEGLVGGVQAAAPMLGSAVIVVVVVGLITLTWALSIIGAAFSWGDFSVQRRKDRIVVTRGLLERREVAVQRGRIQAITVVEELLHQPLGRCAVFVESVGHAEEQGVSTCLHPFLPTDQLRDFLTEIAPGLHAEPALHHPPGRALPRFLFRPTVLWTALVIAVAWFAHPYAWFGLLALPVIWLLAVLSHRETGVGVAERLLVVRSRWATRRTAYVPRNRIQTADSVANIFQRRRKVATFAVVAASGATGRTYAARDLDEQLPSQILEWAARRAPAPEAA